MSEGPLLPENLVIFGANIFWSTVVRALQRVCSFPQSRLLNWSGWPLPSRRDSRPPRSRHWPSPTSPPAGCPCPLLHAAPRFPPHLFPFPFPLSFFSPPSLLPVQSSSLFLLLFIYKYQNIFFQVFPPPLPAQLVNNQLEEMDSVTCGSVSQNITLAQHRGGVWYVSVLC